MSPDSKPINGWVTKFLVGALWGLLTTALVILTTNVIANEDKRVKEATEIRDEFHRCDEKIRIEIKDLARDIRTEQKEQSKRQVEILLVLEKLKP